MEVVTAFTDAMRLFGGWMRQWEEKVLRKHYKLEILGPLSCGDLERAVVCTCPRPPPRPPPGRPQGRTPKTEATASAPH